MFVAMASGNIKASGCDDKSPVLFKRKRGKDPYCTDQQAQTICDLVQTGVPVKYACSLANPPTTEDRFRGALDKSWHLTCLYARARAAFVRDAVTNEDRNQWPRLSFLLERCYRDEFARNATTVTNVLAVSGTSDAVVSRAARLAQCAQKVGFTTTKPGPKKIRKPSKADLEVIDVDSE